MTWLNIDIVNYKGVAQLSHLLLYAAVDGMEGADLEVLDGEYFRGGVETAARSMAFVFAGTCFDEDKGGIGIGDTVSIILPDLTEAASSLIGGKSSACPTCRRAFKIGPQGRINMAERGVDRAIVKFFDTYASKRHARAISMEVDRLQLDREQGREKVGQW